MKQNEYNGMEETVLCTYAKAVYFIGIVITFLQLIGCIVWATTIDAFWPVLLGIASAALLFTPFLMEWALARILAKISTNIATMSANIERQSATLPKGNHTTEFTQPVTKATSKPAAIPTEKPKATPQRQQTERKAAMTEEEKAAILADLARTCSSLVEKMCRLMEMRDEGQITAAEYDTLLERLQ